VKVALDTRAAAQQRGIGRYVRCLREALLGLHGEDVVETHRPRCARADVFHSPWIDGAKLLPPCPMVVTLHDLVPHKRAEEYLRTGLRFRRRYAAVTRATRVIVPTAAVARDAERLLGVERARIAVVHHAVAPVFFPRDADEIARVRARFGLPDAYLLWVGGGDDPRKRLAALRHAPRRLPLVVVGPGAPQPTRGPDTVVTGWVADDDLAAIYSGAHALVFASDEEGFGLPPLEALACGTPVAATDIAATREVLGDRATLVAYDDLAALVRAAEDARRPAPAPAPRTWQDVARETWQVYDEAATRAV
jgi:glycosyltransferase involved in cell wall biosynthesis